MCGWKRTTIWFASLLLSAVVVLLWQGAVGRSSAGPWLSPSGCWGSLWHSSSDGWAGTQPSIFQHAGCWQHREGMWENPRPTYLVRIIQERVREALSSCGASRNVASLSPWWNSKTTLQTKLTRLSSRAAGNPLQLVPCPSHGVPSTHASSQVHVLYPN